MNKLKPFLPHLLVVAAFALLTVAYFYPAFSGYKLRQGDITNFKGMSQEIVEFRQWYGQEPLWTNAMFGGMPAYQISVLYPGDVLGVLDRVITLGLPSPAKYFFLYLLGFYFLLVSLRVKPSLASIGAAAFALSSYFIIILEAGHNSKAHAIGYLAPILAGIIWTYRGKVLLGSAITCLFLALEIKANHVQITYYFGFLVLIYFFFLLAKAIRERTLPAFARHSLILAFVAGVAILANTNNLWNTYQYSQYTTRGSTELTIDAAGQSNAHNTTSGLDRDYVTQWSYGLSETWTFLVPNAMGGASGYFGADHPALKSVDRSMQQAVAQSNTYWGDQPFTSGPVYFGALVVLLFLLGAFLVKGPLKWTLVLTVLLTTALGWGHNAMGLTNFFLDYMPGYNKFRAVTIILSITGFAIVLLGFLFLRELYRDPDLIQREKKKFLAVSGTVAVILLLFVAMPGSFFRFISVQEALAFEAQMAGDNAAQMLTYIEALKSARMSLLSADAIRSLLFVVLGAAALWFYAKRKLNNLVFALALGSLIVIDLWRVDKRYLNFEKDRGRYVKWEEKTPYTQAFEPQTADQFILDEEMQASPVVSDAVKSAEADFATQSSPQFKGKAAEARLSDLRFAALRFHTDYRVLPMSGTFQDSRTSYFHSSVGGYHGAKLRRTQELYDFHIGRELNSLIGVLQNDPTPERVNSTLRNSHILKMLNVKYLIFNPQAPPITNGFANGAVWFVEAIHTVENADEEITELADIDPRIEAVVDRRFADQISGFHYSEAPNAAIAVEERIPNYCKYIYDSPVPQAAVFSEMYYQDGWQAYIDGVKAPHFRANFVLRGMIVPEGSHTIEFKFEPKSYATANTVSTLASILVILLVALAVWKGRNTQESPIGSVSEIPPGEGG